MALTNAKLHLLNLRFVDGATPQEWRSYRTRELLTVAFSVALVSIPRPPSIRLLTFTPFNPDLASENGQVGANNPTARICVDLI
jgi:hypothetical protein